MLGARNDFHFQFLLEGDLGSVVTVDGDAFKDVEEFSFQLLVPVVRNGIPGTPAPGTLRGHGFIHGAEQSDLLLLRSIDEILSEKFVALLVDSGETGEKTQAFVVKGP